MLRKILAMTVLSALLIVTTGSPSFGVGFSRPTLRGNRRSIPGSSIGRQQSLPSSWSF